MTKLVTATSQKFKPGKYLLAVNSAGAGTLAATLNSAGAGTLAATITVEGVGPIAHSDFSVTNVDAYATVDLPECTVIPTITGDVTASLALIS